MAPPQFMEEIGGANPNLRTQPVFMKSSRGGLHMEIKSTFPAAFYVAIFVWEAAPSLKLL